MVLVNISIKIQIHLRTYPKDHANKIGLLPASLSKSLKVSRFIILVFPEEIIQVLFSEDCRTVMLLAESNQPQHIRHDNLAVIVVQIADLFPCGEFGNLLGIEFAMGSGLSIDYIMIKLLIVHEVEFSCSLYALSKVKTVLSNI